MAAKAKNSSGQVKPIYVIGGKDKFLVNSRCESLLDELLPADQRGMGLYQPEADMNEDQVVNGLDVDPFVAAVVGGVQQIPEPSTILLVLIALGVVGGWRKWGG